MRRRLSPSDKKNEDENLTHQSDAPEQFQSAHEPSVAEVKRAIDSGDKRSLTPRILRRLNQTHGADYVRRLSSGAQSPSGNLWAKRSSENDSNMWASRATSGTVQRAKLMDKISPEEEEKMPGGQDKFNFGDAPTMTDDQAKMQEEHAKMGITQSPFGGMSIDSDIFGQGKDPSMPDEDAMLDDMGAVSSETKEDYKDEKYK